MKIEELTLDRYVNQILPAWEFKMLKDCPAPFADQVVWPWFNEIAPKKAALYGMEAWLTLGAAALVVETNGGFFRWKHMVETDVPRDTDEYLDTIRDTFGYAVMMGVLTFETPENLGDMYPDTWPYDAQWCNDTLIEEVWKKRNDSMAFWLAFAMSYQMFVEGDKDRPRWHTHEHRGGSDVHAHLHGYRTNHSHPGMGYGNVSHESEGGE